jgi:ribosome-associated protein
MTILETTRLCGGKEDYMETSDLIQDFIKVLEEHKADNLVAFDVRGKSSIADYYIICSGTSDVHLRALMNSLIKEMKDTHNLLPRNTEGSARSQWVLVDYADIIIHIFHPEARKKYAIENLHKNKIIVYPGPDWEFPEPTELDEEEMREVVEKIPEFLQ